MCVSSSFPLRRQLPFIPTLELTADFSQSGLLNSHATSLDCLGEMGKHALSEGIDKALLPCAHVMSSSYAGRVRPENSLKVLVKRLRYFSKVLFGCCLHTFILDVSHMCGYIALMWSARSLAARTYGQFSIPRGFQHQILPYTTDPIFSARSLRNTEKVGANS